MRRHSLILIPVVLMILAACNLDAPGGNVLRTTLEPTRPTYIAPTPYIAPTLIPQQGFSGQSLSTPAIIVATVTPGNLLTPVPAQTLIQNPQPSPNSQNAIEAFVNNLLVPAWNFIYTFILEGLSTLWLFAGARGGVLAQVFCCVAPLVVVVIVVVLRFRLLRFWR